MAAIADPSLLNVAHIIQLALTPIFLLSGIAALLNVFSGRLSRVADQVDATTSELDRERPDDAEHLRRTLRSLKRRSHTLDVAMILGSVGGVATGISVLTLFLGALNGGAAFVLLVNFGVGVVCTVAAMGAFLIESLLSSRGVRREVRRAEEAKPKGLHLPHLTLAPFRRPDTPPDPNG